MSVMDDMLAWLTTTLDELQEIAEDSVEAWDKAIGWDEPAAHIMRHSPRAVLARVAAEREIVRLYVAAVEANTEIAEGRETYSIDPDAREQIEAEHYTREDALEEAVAWIAWGHRHDAPGFVTGWAPQDAVVSS